MSEPAEANVPQGPGDPDVAASGPDRSSQEVLPRKFGKYTLLRKLAVGGMAELYLALHRSVAGFEKLVVIKRILPDMAKDQGFITMLLNEARIAATFSHPNIVTIFDVGQVDKTYFIAMEHIHGEDLRSIVRAMKPKSVVEFPIEHAIGIALGVAAGLAYAHDKRDLNGNPLNIVHRDISPQNVIVTFTGDVKVVDFGIAKASRTGDQSPESLLAASVSPQYDSEHHTKIGQLKGKVPYMSPEQARGETLDGRSDIFSVGVILFELATGRRLFRGANEYETLRMITEGEYPRPTSVNSRISSALEAVILKALARDPAQRYRHAHEMVVQLEAVVRDERIPVSTLALGNWMQSLFDEKLASQREALLQGKQLADVIAAEEPEAYTVNSSGGGALSLPAPARASRAPWIVALGGLVAVGAVVAGLYFRQETQREAAAAEQRAIRSGMIEVHSVPEGASVWLNDAPTAYHTPYTLNELETGPNARFTVRLTAAGYEPYVAQVPLPQRYAHVTVQAQLEHAHAQSYAVLEVTTTPRGATVLIDGREIPGSTPLTVPQIAPGVEHTVLVRHADAQDEVFTFVAQPGAIERRPLALRERPLAADEAWLSTTADPPNTVLRIGDRELLSGPFRVRVHAGDSVRLLFSAPGFDSESRVVHAQPGETVTLPNVHLSRPHSSGSSEANVDRRPGSLRVGSTPWCNVTVDGSARGQTPVDISSIAPGGHTVVCSNPAHGSQTQRVTVEPGALAIARFRLP